MKIKIKNNKKNIIYVLLGRLTSCVILYVIGLQVGYYILNFVIDRITILK